MQKLKLDLDALEVASFEVSPEVSGVRGTVEANITPTAIAASLAILGGARLGYQVATLF